jgi:ribosomal protein S18 acetylase RimI-like enzyme
MASVSVRKSILADLKTLADFQQRLAKESESFELDLSTVKKGIQAMFDDPSRGTYFIAEVDGVIAGCHSVTYEWSDWRNGMVWWLQSVYVAEQFRKNGVFKAMYDNLQSLIKADPNVVGLRLYVDKSNAAAQKVYASIGMNGDHYAVFELMK